MLELIFPYLILPTIRLTLFLSSELLLVCLSATFHWKASIKKQEGHIGMSSGTGKIPISWLRTQSFPSYVAESTSFAFVHISVLSPQLCWDYWLLAFHWKITFVVMWCGLLNIVYVAFLVSVKGLKSLMCKLPKGSFVFFLGLFISCMWLDTLFLYFYHCWMVERKSIPVDQQITVQTVWVVTL